MRVLEVRHPDGSAKNRRVDWVVLEWRESYEGGPDDADVQTAEVCVDLWDIKQWQKKAVEPCAQFCASYSAQINSVSLTSSRPYGGAYVILPASLRGAGLATYVMSELVSWAKRWPDAEICPINLAAGDAKDPKNKLRRNRFYQAFGFVFVYDDDEQATGVSRPMTARQLKDVTSWTETISDYGLIDHMRKCAEAAEETRYLLHAKGRDLKELNRLFGEAEKRPLRWILGRWIKHYPLRIGVAGVVVLAGTTAWLRWPQ